MNSYPPVYLSRISYRHDVDRSGGLQSTLHKQCLDALHRWKKAVRVTRQPCPSHLCFHFASTSHVFVIFWNSKSRWSKSTKKCGKKGVKTSSQELKPNNSNWWKKKFLAFDWSTTSKIQRFFRARVIRFIKTPHSRKRVECQIKRKVWEALEGRTCWGVLVAVKGAEILGNGKGQRCTSD